MLLIEKLQIFPVHQLKITTTIDNAKSCPVLTSVIIDVVPVFTSEIFLPVQELAPLFHSPFPNLLLYQSCLPVYVGGADGTCGKKKKQN